MHIVIVLGALELGGAERQALLLAENLRRDFAHEVSIVGFGLHGRVVDICAEKNIVCYPFPAPPCVNPGDKRRPHRNLLRFAWFLRKLKPQGIISFTSSANLASAFTWRLAGAMFCIWSQRDAGIERAYLDAWPAALRNPAFFTANSPAGIDVLRDYGVAKEKCRVIHNGVVLPSPVRSGELWRQDIGVTPGARIACMVANLSANKDHETLIKAWGKATRNGKLQACDRLLLAGRNDGKLEPLQKLAESEGVLASVVFLGPVHDIAGLLQSVDVGVFSSLSEGLPNAVQEGMLLGLPFVASDIPGVRAAFGGDSPNIVVEPGNSDAFAAGIAVLFGDAALRESIGTFNRALAEIYTPERMSHAFEVLISLCFTQACQNNRVAFFVASVRDMVVLFDMYAIWDSVKNIAKKILGARGRGMVRDFLGKKNSSR